MKIKVAIIIIFCFLITSCKQEDNSEPNVLDNGVEKFSNRSSVSYKLEYRIKYFDYLDTTSLSANTILIREKEDSLFGGYIWHSRRDSINNYIKYYDGKSFYLVDNITQKVTRFDPKGPVPYMFTNNFDGKLINTYFLKNERLKRYLEDSLYETEIFNKNGFYQISISFPDGAEVINQSKDIFFDHSENAIAKIIFRAELDGLQEYNEWNLSSIKFDKHKPEDLEQNFLRVTNEYEFDDYVPPSKEDLAPLQKGDKATNFKGDYLINSSQKFELENIRGKIVILDFWFKNCPPCIKAIPQLNNIHEKYKSQDVMLLGLNDVDTDSLSRDKLVPFRQKEGMEYPTILIDDSVTIDYKVRGYPTFYIINKDGEIAYSKLGYSENMEKEVDSVLHILLK